MRPGRLAPTVTGDPLPGAAWTAEALFTELYTTHYRRLVAAAWMVLRDPAADMSLSVSCAREAKAQVGERQAGASRPQQVQQQRQPQFNTHKTVFDFDTPGDALPHRHQAEIEPVPGPAIFS